MNEPPKNLPLLEFPEWSSLDLNKTLQTRLLFVEFMEEGSVEAFAKLQGQTESWYVKNLPFVFGRKSEKSPEDFLDICMGEPDKTVSREHAILTYSKELVFTVYSIDR